MRKTTLALILVAFASVAGGCDAALLRPYQQMDLPTHSRQLAFDAAKEVIGKHFEIATASWVKGVIESKPQLFDGKKSGTLADYRGAGGRWRRIVSFELADDGSSMIGQADVRLEREATDQAIAASRTGGYEEGTSGRLRSDSLSSSTSTRSSQVWVDAGHDDALAKELLSEIAAQVSSLEKREVRPALSSPEKDIEESRKYRDDDRP
jgi:hypothetical protein